MPELPEVQTIVTDLKRKILHKGILEVEIRLGKIIEGKKEDFRKTLRGAYFTEIGRRGKFIILKFKKGGINPQYLLVHLRMTGQLIYKDRDKTIYGGHGLKKEITSPLNKHTHLIFYFYGGGRLFFNDLRRFGRWRIISLQQKQKLFRNFGVEPLSPSFKLTTLKRLSEGKKINVKSFLLNQKFIAGIGNIYADEILFASQILPSRSLFFLTAGEFNKLFSAIKSVLRKALEYRGTTFSDYIDANGKQGGYAKLLKVYQREGQPCRNCSHKIVKKKIAGRGTRYCSFCQK